MSAPSLRVHWAAKFWYSSRLCDFAFNSEKSSYLLITSIYMKLFNLPIVGGGDFS